MRFATKFDGLIVFGLIVGGALSVGLPMRAWLLHRLPAAIPLGICAVWAYVLLSTLPQYYEVRDDGLFLRLGVARRVLIPYSSLVELLPDTSARSAGVFSFDRIQIATASRTYIIAPEDPAGFLNAVALRTPHLGRKGSGLAPQWTSPAI